MPTRSSGARTPPTSRRPFLVQATMFEFIARGYFEPNLESVRAGLRERRDAMLAALERSFPADASWSRPEGGYFVWLDLGDGVDTAELAIRAEAEGVDVRARRGLLPARLRIAARGRPGSRSASSPPSGSPRGSSGSQASSYVGLTLGAVCAVVPAVEQEAERRTRDRGRGGSGRAARSAPRRRRS